MNDNLKFDLRIDLKRFLTIVSLIFISSGMLAQSFEIGHTSLVFYDSIRDRDISTEFYYPADNPGDNEPVSVGNFPVLVFGHGFLMSWDSYQNFWTELVPDGYVICFPTTETGISPNHQQLGEDLRFLAARMQIETLDSTSLFFNSLAPETALLGHSMGGGASFLAAENNAAIHTLINFAAAETNPSAISASVNVSVPTLIFSGDDDCVTPPDQNQDPMYDSLSSDCKTHISIKNGGHCYFANDNFICSLGESTCNSSLSITREEQHLVTFDFLNLWLKYTLYNDQDAFNIFNDSLQSSTRINFSKFCPTASMQHLINPIEFEVFPNPVNKVLNLEIPARNVGGKLCIYSMLGEIVYQKFVHTCSSQIDVTKFPAGTYYLVYQTDSVKFSQMLVSLENN